MMLAARGAFLAARRNSKPTARSYVQDGLIAMWDGIENAGWGVHDAAATRWVDLAGSCDLYKSGNCKIGESYVQTFSAGDFMRNTDHAFSSSNIQTVETVYQADSAKACLVFNIIPSDRFFGFRGNGSIVFFVSNGYNFTVTGVTTTQSYSYRYSISNELVVNGASFVSSVRGGSFGTQGIGLGLYSQPYNSVGKMYCMRLYSRALTAAEIAANYAVDKARFNLPDAT